jgi:hypothetical protein
MISITFCARCCLFVVCAISPGPIKVADLPTQAERNMAMLPPNIISGNKFGSILVANTSEPKEIEIRR